MQSRNPEAGARRTGAGPKWALLGTLVLASLVTSGTAVADRKVVNGLECKSIADSDSHPSRMIVHKYGRVTIDELASDIDDWPIPVYCAIEREQTTSSHSLDDLDVYMSVLPYRLPSDHDDTLCGVFSQTRTLSIIDSEVQYSPGVFANDSTRNYYTLDFDRLDNDGSTWTNFLMVCHLYATSTVHNYKYYESD